MTKSEEFYSEYQKDYYREEPTDSFLAGIFFCKKNIDYSDYSKLKNAFENKYGIEVVDKENLKVQLVAEGTTIRLIDDYNDIININGKYMTVRSYLYSQTSEEVREFFELKEPNENIISNYIKGVFGKKGRR